ncbi:AAA domain-containing protein [Pedobacter sp.]|uniref:AAA domain-containing protein n=1 Tax=Pedobacter sp. TaxID=1411316 RepID=UPI003D7F550E
MEYFNRLQQLLQLEQEEDLRNYQQLTSTSSIADRRGYGLSWYPVAIRGSEMSRGDYLSVEFERTTHHDLPHQLRFGMPAALFSNHHPKTDRVEGIISYVGGNKLKLTLKTDELPDWASDGKLGIDLLFDNNSYDEMKKALRAAALPDENNTSSSLVKILTGEKSPAFKTMPFLPVIDSLNASQQQAVDLILSAQDLAIVHGPPGTGKTTTLVQAIKALNNQNHQQVLVVAPSNTAVDLLSEKLAAQGLKVIRVGNPARVSAELMSLTLDHHISVHPMMKEIKSLKKRAAEYKNMAHKYKRNFGRAEKEQRKALFDEAYKIMKEVDKTEQYITDQVLDGAQVIAATLVGANHYTVRQRKYATVLVDEAGQALEPANWIPILKADKVIFAGDHNQLPPTIKSLDAAKGGLTKTLFEKCVSLHPQAVALLDEQYRMHQQIMGYPSKAFYENKLKAHATVAKNLLYPGDEPLLFIDTSGCGFEEKAEGTSTINPDEAALLLKHLTDTVNILKFHYTLEHFPTIGIISPYKQQIQVIKDLLAQTPVLSDYGCKITVNTIDSFQGQERDMVYISLTRSNNDGQIGFLADIRRMNVAMTRARKKLVVFGDSATLSRHAFYDNFIQYAEQQNAYHSAWEFMTL